MNDPAIPLKNAELLHVAMSTVIHVLHTRTDYPVDNLEIIVSAYRMSRDKHLKSIGFTERQIKAFTEAAAEALVTWLDEREDRKKITEYDFAEWAKELLDDESPK